MSLIIKKSLEHVLNIQAGFELFERFMYTLQLLSSCRRTQASFSGFNDSKHQQGSDRKEVKTFQISLSGQQLIYLLLIIHSRIIIYKSQIVAQILFFSYLACRRFKCFIGVLERQINDNSQQSVQFLLVKTEEQRLQIHIHR
ncbi:Hypothetical_protein [Hexamita inflata]|uniref:Hypothetical_protein n=1 Tax=Hexamita inflata TaxID=28002 RepID=A0AA86PW59_9EUKA|nr:Hypothetical protein HINF_LOCUS33763 [Hexamita inflata]CAI9946121.1 Hypothetical protein HINF_LOCUS33766 [Hexamita inflata]CAI9946126.1 Hypothetical protein HINF_LOCUS33771 [Hexamita inflata]CAI9946127.1 Hypothetical protein HINF_LOCUS33772 [Hexamita inflata]